jgi:hypothetical protein
MFVFLYLFSFRESIVSEPRIPLNQDTNVDKEIKSERIVLSSKIDPDCPFFV